MIRNISAEKGSYGQTLHLQRAFSFSFSRLKGEPATACQLPIVCAVTLRDRDDFILRLFLLLQEYCKYLLINVTCLILIESRFPLHFLSFTERVKVWLMLHRRSCSALQESLTSISLNLNYSRDEKLETHRHCSMHAPTHLFELQPASV